MLFCCEAPEVSYIGTKRPSSLHPLTWLDRLNFHFFGVNSSFNGVGVRSLTTVSYDTVFPPLWRCSIPNIHVDVMIKKHSGVFWGFFNGQTVTCLWLVKSDTLPAKHVSRSERPQNGLILNRKLVRIQYKPGEDRNGVYWCAVCSL